jgi:hypothetical protein
MALELKVNYSISNDKTKLIVTDATGVYDVNNTSGWGSPNTERNAIGLFCYVSYQPFDKALIDITSTQAITPVYLFDNTYLNSEVSTFEFNYTKDGWYRIVLVALTEAEYAILEASDYESLINSELYPNVFSEDIIMVKLITQKNCQTEKYITCLECTSCKCDQIKEELLKLDALIQAADYRFHSEKQFEAQKMVETLTKQYNCCK